MDKWKKAIDSLQLVKPLTSSEKLELVNYQYGYIAWCIDQHKRKEAMTYLTRAENEIKLLEEQACCLSDLYAYKAAFIGFKIGISPYKAPFIGSESFIYAKKSIALDSTNALAYIQLGNIFYYMPALFGGSKAKAIACYKHALNLMDKKYSQVKRNWNYLNLLAAIIIAYNDTEQYETARDYCIKTLEAEPGFEWVKNNLYPEILNNIR